MFTVWVVFHVLVCIALVLVVLLQSSKGEGLAGSAFGGGGGGLSGAVFGGRGAASFLQNATTVLAVVFMVNCGALALMSSSTRPGLGGSSDEVESTVTRQAQAEMERAMQQQQMQQEQQAVPADSGAGNLLEVMTSEGQAQPAQDSAGQ